MSLARQFMSTLIPEWKITLGRYKTAEECVRMLEAKGICLDSVKGMFGIFQYVEFRHDLADLYLARASFEQVGVTKAMCTLEDLMEAVQPFGGLYIPAEAAPALREVYLDQPLNDVIFLAMKPIDNPHLGPQVMQLGHGLKSILDHRHVLSLTTADGSGRNLFHPSREIVFAVPPPV